MIQVEQTKEINSEEWPVMSFEELLYQKNILFDRWEFLRNSGNDNASVVLEGLQKIETFIQLKLNNS